MRHESHIATTEPAPRQFPPLTPETLGARESMESNPDMYVTRIHPADFLTHANDIEESLGDLASGFVDLRNTAPREDSPSGLNAADEEDKNVVWIGYDHYQIAQEAAQFPSGQNMKDYMVGIKTSYDVPRQRMIIQRSVVGQSCDRTEDQMHKLLDAAETALTRDIIEHNPELQRRYFLKKYGLAQNVLQERNALIEVEVPELIRPQEECVEPYDMALLSEIDGRIFENSDEVATLERKIADLLPRMNQSSKASIRIPFNLISRGENRDDIDELGGKIRTFARQFEKDHEETACEVVHTRSAFHREHRPDEEHGFILVVPVF